MRNFESSPQCFRTSKVIKVPHSPVTCQKIKYFPPRKTSSIKFQNSSGALRGRGEKIILVGQIRVEI